MKIDVDDSSIKCYSDTFFSFILNIDEVDPFITCVKCSMHSVVWSRNVISQRLFC